MCSKYCCDKLPITRFELLDADLKLKQEEKLCIYIAYFVWVTQAFIQQEGMIGQTNSPTDYSTYLIIRP